MAKKEISRTFIFESMTPYKAILTLAIPNVVNQLANVIYNLADTFYIGRLNNSSMVAAITVTTFLVLILTALSNLLCIGSCAVIASSLGSKNRKKAEDIALMTPIMALVFGIFITAVMIIFRKPIALYSGASETSLAYTMQYQFWVMGMNAIPILVSTSLGAGMRGYGYSKYEMYGITMGNILNIILDPIFIFGFGMGINGAGFATFLSAFISMCYFIVQAQRMQKRNHLYTEYRNFSFNFSYAWQVITTGFPAFLHSLLASLVNTASMNIMKTYSDAAIASLGIVRKIEHFFGQMIIGLNQGVIPLISYNYANKNYDRLKKVRDKTVQLCMLWGLVALVILFPLAKQFMMLFINDPETIKFGTPLVQMYAFIVLTMAYNNNARCVLQALGKKRQSSVYSIVRQVILYLPLLIILNKLFGFYGAAFAPIAADLISDITGFFITRNVFRQIKAECEAPE
ncbi:MAG: MATE family efflux transporter [Firmicutes bacterium]|nr:MATE family efflux transporter [Bacillota bacterium]